MHQSIRRSRARAWLVATGASGMAVLALVALVLLLPLIEFAPYVLTVDKSTGFIAATRGLQLGDLSEDEAITMANIAHYIIARETYDPADLQDNYQLVLLTSSGRARKEYEQQFARQNPNNPVNRLGQSGEVRVTIKHISFLSLHTASVRFQTDLISAEAKRIDHWVAVLRVERPMPLSDRFKNPLGFEVTSYRRDQEIVNH